MNPIQEIIGAVNYWVNASGIAYAVRNHVEWACQQILKIKVPQTLVTDNVYLQMYRRGWMRVAILGERINVDFSRMTGEQADWLQNEANTRQIPVIDDRNRTIMEPEPPMAESVVDRLLS
jgi:hypothetical protein